MRIFKENLKIGRRDFTVHLTVSAPKKIDNSAEKLNKSSQQKFQKSPTLLDFFKFVSKYFVKDCRYGKS